MQTQNCFLEIHIKHSNVQQQSISCLAMQMLVSLIETQDRCPKSNQLCWVLQWVFMDIQSTKSHCKYEETKIQSALLGAAVGLHQHSKPQVAL